MKKRLLCLSDLFPAFLYDECPLSLQGRANAPETFTRILSFIIMKSVNYPHANLANHAKTHHFTRVCHPDGYIRAIAMYDFARFARFA